MLAELYFMRFCSSHNKLHQANKPSLMMSNSLNWLMMDAMPLLGYASIITNLLVSLSFIE